MNVVETWRNRANRLRAEYWRCDACGALAAVRRLGCTICGAAMTEARPAQLPRTMVALGFSHAHVAVETMDQVEGLKPVMLVRGAGGQTFALPLCEADASLGSRLVGENVELVLRREGPARRSEEPIAYTRKVAASASVRSRLKRNETKSK